MFEKEENPAHPHERPDPLFWADFSRNPWSDPSDIRVSATEQEAEQVSRELQSYAAELQRIYMGLWYFGVYLFFKVWHVLRNV